MKRALCVILIISMLLSMLAGCSDGDSAKHDDTIVVDGLTIDTTKVDRAGLYDLYWIPLPTGRKFTRHDEIEYDSSAQSDKIKTVYDAFISYEGDLVIPVYHRTEEAADTPAPLSLMSISLDDFAYEIKPLEWNQNELTVYTPSDDRDLRYSNLWQIVPTYDGGYFGYLQNGDNHYFIRWDHDGKRISKIDVMAAVEAAGESQILPGWYTSQKDADNKTAKLRYYDYILDVDGNLYIMGNNDTGGVNEVCAWSSDGEFLYSFQLLGSFNPSIMTRLVTVDSDGQAGLVAQNRTAGNLGYAFYLFDDEQRDIGDPVQLVESNLTSAPQLAPGFDAYHVAAMGIQAHLKGIDPIMLINWVDYDIRFNNVKSVKVIDANRIFFTMKDPETGEYKLGLFSAEDIEGHVAEQLSAGKTELTLAYIESSNANSEKTIEEYVSEFNLTNQNYRVKLLAYKPVGNQSAEDMLVMDIVSGKIPDMILFDSDMNYRAFDNLGVCRNLYEFMDKDAVYTRDKFIGAVKEPFENAKGELPYLTILSGISTLVMSKDMADGLDGWTMTELAEYIKTLDKDQYFIDVTTSVSADPAMALLKVLLPNTICHYVDYDSGKSNFGGDLAKMLEICKNTKISQSYNGVEPKNYRDQKVAVLAIGNVATVQTFLRHRYAYYSGAEIAYLGYPTNGDCGSVIVPIASLAITTKSANPDGAWEFIKACLAYQHDEWEYTADPAMIEAGNMQYINFNNGFPCVIETARRMCETLSHYFFQFSLSESKEKPGHLMVGTSKGGMHFAADGSYGDNVIVNMYKDDVSSTFYSLAEDDAENLLGLLNDITMVRSLDNDLLDIIYEDAQYYFGGTKSLDETVRIIENRVGIKLAE